MKFGVAKQVGRVSFLSRRTPRGSMGRLGVRVESWGGFCHTDRSQESTFGAAGVACPNDPYDPRKSRQCRSFVDSRAATRKLSSSTRFSFESFDELGERDRLEEELFVILGMLGHRRRSKLGCAIFLEGECCTVAKCPRYDPR